MLAAGSNIAAIDFPSLPYSTKPRPNPRVWIMARFYFEVQLSIFGAIISP